MRRAVLLGLFPTLLLALLALEKAVTYLIGVYPAAEALWWLSIELRSVFREISNSMAEATGYSLLMQAAVFSASVLGVWWLAAPRRRVFWAFLVNHAALLLAVMGMLTANPSMTASAGIVGLSGGLALPASFNITWFGSLLATLGVLACAYCHFAFLSSKRRAHAPVQGRLRELQFDL